MKKIKYCLYGLDDFLYKIDGNLYYKKVHIPKVALERLFKEHPLYTVSIVTEKTYYRKQK